MLPPTADGLVTVLDQNLNRGNSTHVQTNAIPQVATNHTLCYVAPELHEALGDSPRSFFTTEVDKTPSNFYDFGNLFYNTLNPVAILYGLLRQSRANVSGIDAADRLIRGGHGPVYRVFSNVAYGSRNPVAEIV